MSVRRSAPVTVWMLALLTYVTAAVLGGNLQAGEPYELPHALDFDGADSYVETEATAANMGIEGNHAKTVEAWVYTRDFNNGAVFSLGAQGSDGSDVTLRTQNPQNQWLATFWGHGIKFSYPSTDRWVHFAIVHTGSEAIVYADGEEAARASGELDTHPEESFEFGRQGKGPYFNGMIGEVRVWNRALSGAEITDHIKKPLTGREDGLVGYWPMNRGEGNMVADRSGNKHHGKIVNAKWREVVIPAQIRAAPSERVVPALVKRLTQHPSGRARIQAARGLGMHVTAERVKSVLLDAGKDVHEAKEVRPAVLLALEYYKNLPDAPDYAAAELASALLDVLHGGKNADEARDTARDILDELDHERGDTALAPVLLDVLEDAEDTDTIRRAVLDGTGALDITAEYIDKEAENPYPETRVGIDRYKEFVIGTYHQKICAYPDTVREISTLQELFEYAGKSGVHVRMEPGVYSIGLDNYEDLWSGDSSLLKFTGDHSFFDLRGVTLRIDTAIGEDSGQLINEAGVSGDHIILQGMSVRMIGKHKAVRAGSWNRGQTFTQFGNNNLIKGVEVVSRGSWPYGFGEYKHTVDFRNELRGESMRSAFEVKGQHNMYVDVKIYHRGIGHALHWGGDLDLNHTWIDCIVQGEVRLSDDILKQNKGGGFYDDASTLPDDLDLSEYMNPGEIIPLTEDAYRSYGGGQALKVLGGTVKHCRDAFKRGSYDDGVFISNVRISGITQGVFGGIRASGMKKIVNCEVDLGCGTMRFKGPGLDADITVTPNSFENSPPTKHNSGNISALVKNRENEIILRAGKNLNIENVKKNQPIKVIGAGHKIRNETGLPIKLSESTENCQVITNGKVTDNGKGNEIKHTD